MSERPAATPVATHVLGAWLSASVVALGEVVVDRLGTSARPLRAIESVMATLHLVALYALCAIAAGAVLGLAVHALSRSALGQRLLGEEAVRAWTAASPSLVARVLVDAVAALALGVAVAIAHAHLAEAAPAPTLGAAVLALGALALVGLLARVRRPFAGRLRVLAFRVGRAASPAVLAALFAAAIAAASIAFVATQPDLLLAYPLPTLLWFPIVIAIDAMLLALTRRARQRRPRAVPRMAALAVLATVALTSWSAVSFGDSNRVRSLVEQRTVLGRRIVRALRSLSDRDGDRYAGIFGGGDCDDWDASTHPGAIDEEGDGVDRDCFAGDGAPVIVTRGGGEYGRIPEGLSRPNFLVVTIDALRRDHLGAGGYERPTSPHIDAFAEQSVVFDAVVPQSSRSLRSIPAMWTGNYPSEIAFGPEYLWPALLDENVTAAEELARGGYGTSAIMATNYFERIDRFFQGFAEVRQFEIPDPPRHRAVDEGLSELRRLVGGPAPWLLWIHLYNCHVPYLQDGVPSLFGPEQIDFYDTEITLADAQFQRLLDALEALGVADRTVVVLASDHGEGFGEHGTFGHSTTLYEEELKSVLMLRIPGVSPRRIDSLVALLDVTPTLLNLAGIPIPGEVSGRSLVPFATGERAPDHERTVFAELLPDGLAPFDIKTLRRGSRKMMWWVRDGTFQLYDLAVDPGERHDLSDERRTEALELLGELRAWVARASRAENRTDVFVEQNRLRAVPPGVTRRLDIRYAGLFTVAAIDLPETRLAPGDRIPLTLYYRVEGSTNRDLFFMIDVHGPPGTRLPAHFHAWHYPMHGRYPTSRWEPGEIVRDPTPIVIPVEAPAPGRYRLELRVRDGEQYLLGEHHGVAETSVLLGEIEVVRDEGQR